MKIKIYAERPFLLLCMVAFCLSGPAPVFAVPQEAIQKAKQFYDNMDYDTAISELNGFINTNKSKKDKHGELSEAYYLLAKIFFEVGEDFKIVDRNLLMVFTYTPGFDKAEVNPDFKKRVAAVKKLAEMQRKTAAPVTAEPAAAVKPQPAPVTPEPQKEEPKPAGAYPDNIVPLPAVDVPPALKDRPHLVLSRRIRDKYRNQRIHFIVELLIDEKGKVTEIKAISGLDKFIEKEMKAYLKKWRFIAASKDGRKVKTWKPTTIEFNVTTETRKQFK